MSDPLRYYAQFRSAGSGWAALPPWARSAVALLAIPGLLCVALSILLLGISIVALLLLTVPAYRVLRALTGNRTPAPTGVAPADPNPFGSLFGVPTPGRRQVAARVVDGDGPPGDRPTDGD